MHTWWGSKTFDNDYALSWMMDFSDNPTVEVLEKAINLVLIKDVPNELESSQALAAADFVALLRLQWPSDPRGYTEEVSGTLGKFKAFIPKTTVELALSAVKKISTKSALRNKYAKHAKAFTNAMDQLTVRLTRAQKETKDEFLKRKKQHEDEQISRILKN